MIHLTLNQISAHIDAELPEASVELVRLHLSSCLECAERFGHMEEQEEALSRLLTNDPGERFFEGFAGRVLGPGPAVVKPQPERVRKTVEPKQAPAARARKAAEPKETAAPRGRGPARVLVPAAALLLLMTAVAVIAIRPRPAGLPRGGFSHQSVPGVESPESSAPPALAQVSPEESGKGSGLLESAAAGSAEAEREGTAESYDRAAAAWEAALPGLETNPDELAAGRHEIAFARYGAWRRAGSAERRAAAMSAVRAYLLCAPAGAERDRAWTWLAELKR